MSPQQAANTLWAFASLGQVQHTKVAAAVGNVAVRYAKHGKLAPQGLANTCWGLAVFGMIDRELLEDLAPSLESARCNFDHRAWTQVYSAHCLDLQQANGLNLAGSQSPCLHLCRRPGLRPSGRLPMQVFLAELAARASLQGNRPVLSGSLLEKAEYEWRQRLVSQPPSNHRRCAPIAAAIEDLGWDVALRHPPCSSDGLLTTDIVLELPGHLVALEVDTAFYLACNDRRCELGRMLLHHRLLHQLGGMTVVKMPVYEWEGIQYDPNELAGYIKRKVSFAVGHIPSAKNWRHSIQRKGIDCLMVPGIR